MIGPRGPLSWDTFGYVTQALTGQIGGLGLGRPVFIATSHAIAHGWLRLGGSVWQVESLLRTWWLVVAATAAPATRRLARACGASSRAAWIAGFVVALSPAAAQTADNVLTDGASAAFVLWSLVFAVRALDATPGPAMRRAILAGVCFGLACGLRESSAAFALALVLLVPCASSSSRWRLALVTTASAVLTLAIPLAITIATQPGYIQTIRAWMAAMARERATHAYGLRDFGFYLMWLVAFGPLPLVAAIIAWTRRSDWLPWRWTTTTAVCVASLAQWLALAAYQDIAYGPRYLVAAFPGAIAIPAAFVLDRWIGRNRPRLVFVAAAIALPVVIAAPFVHAREAPLRQTIDDLPAALLALPPNSVIVTGQPCPAIGLVQEELRWDPSMRDRTFAWETVCPGWGWPPSLAARLDQARARGDAIVLDLRPSSWPGSEQPEFLTNVIAYAREHAGVIAWRSP